MDFMDFMDSGDMSKSPYLGVLEVSETYLETLQMVSLGVYIYGYTYGYAQRAFLGCMGHIWCPMYLWECTGGQIPSQRVSE